MIFLGALGFYVPYMMMVSHGLVPLLDMGVADSIASLSVGTITFARAAGHLLGGWVTLTSYTAAFIMIIGVNVLGLICTAFIRPPQRKNKKAART